MSKILSWIIVVLIVVGGAFWLSRVDTTKETTRVEKVVSDNALAH